jgi:hypothetical protein
MVTSLRGLRSFAPLGLVSDAAMTMIARPSFPVSDLRGYMEPLRRDKDKLNLPPPASAHPPCACYSGSIPARRT